MKMLLMRMKRRLMRLKKLSRHLGGGSKGV